LGSIWLKIQANNLKGQNKERADFPDVRLVHLMRRHQNFFGRSWGEEQAQSIKDYLG
jgi:hypothetical protein